MDFKEDLDAYGVPARELSATTENERTATRNETQFRLP